nr:5'/3'-nucleotidase SurE [Sedimentibacter sp.]
MIKILLTNDDGIFAEGIEVLAEIVKDFGEIYVAAPDRQRSAVSHGIAIHDPITVKKYNFPIKVAGAWSIGSTPADCVRLALNNLLTEKPDLILSGINNGTNYGGDILYSGTVAGAIEGYQYKIPSLALSLDGNNFDVCRRYLGEFIEKYIQTAMNNSYVLNVNIPSCESEEFKGIVYARLSGPGQYPFYFKEEKIDEETSSYELHSQDSFNVEEDSDIDYVKQGYISVTPIAPNYENHQHTKHLKNIGLVQEIAALEA